MDNEEEVRRKGKKKMNDHHHRREGILSATKIHASPPHTFSRLRDATQLFFIVPDIVHDNPYKSINMAQQNIPIIFQEKMNICQMGISSSDVKFGSVTLESSKYLCAKNSSGEKKSLNVYQADTRSTSQFPFGGDSAIMNPISKIIGLRAGQKLQIFNIDLKSK